MERGSFIHNIKTLKLAVLAAAEAFDETQFILVGSIGPLLAHSPDAPPLLRTSLDIDLFPINHADHHIAADSLVGAGSIFEIQNHFYIERVGAWTVMTTPAGWQSRSKELRFGKVIAYALSIQDALWNKLEAGRPKDLDYCSQIFACGICEETSFRDYVANAESPTNPESFALSRETVVTNLDKSLSKNS